MKVFQGQNHLIIKENPGCLWIFGLFFAAFGCLFIYGAFNGFVFFGTQAPWAVNLTFFLGLIGILIGFWIIYQSPVNNLTIDKILNEVTITRWGVFGKRTEIYSFDEIERFCLIETHKNNGGIKLNFGLQLIDNGQVIITSLGHQAEDFENKFIYPINVFIGKELPSCQLNFEPQDETEDKMS